MKYNATVSCQFCSHISYLSLKIRGVYICAVIFSQLSEKQLSVLHASYAPTIALPLAAIAIVSTFVQRSISSSLQYDIYDMSKHVYLISIYSIYDIYAMP